MQPINFGQACTTRLSMTWDHVTRPAMKIMLQALYFGLYDIAKVYLLRQQPLQPMHKEPGNETPQLQEQSSPIANILSFVAPARAVAIGTVSRDLGSGMRSTGNGCTGDSFEQGLTEFLWSWAVASGVVYLASTITYPLGKLVPCLEANVVRAFCLRVFSV
jgi:hypothetical protein